MARTKVVDIDQTRRFFPSCDGERQPILDELNRILGHPLFANSKRYPNLLRYVVDQRLAGSSDGVKERTLGVEVFGRDPHYDTNADPIVRTTAVEIRKRLQEYYGAAGKESPIRIQLPAGSYVPEFIVAPPADAADVIEAPVLVSGRPGLWANRLTFAVIAVALAAVAVAAAWSRPWFLDTASEGFWEPLLASPRTILICMGGKDAAGSPGRTPPSLLSWISPGATAAEVQQADLVALSDATALSRVAGFLQTKMKPFQVRGERSTTFTDLRDSPAVLIGAFNNAWTLRLSRQFRYSYEQESGPDGRVTVAWISDRQKPNSRDWRNEPLSPYTGLRADYALISRVLDPETQQWIVAVGGLLKWGTLAAAEFLADPNYMEEIARQAPAGWQHKNLQIVLDTRIYGGTPGPPRVLAAHFW